jgi:hypothetical protein
MIAADLVRRGYKIAIPYGEDWDFDLIVCRHETLERVQCKYTRSDGTVITRQVRVAFADERARARHEALHRGDDRLAGGVGRHHRTLLLRPSDGTWGRDADDAPAIGANSEQSSGGHPRGCRLPRDLSGASRIRTGGLVGASDALYQLSYGPVGLKW